jgi:excisionase family DNA binding protein
MKKVTKANVVADDAPVNARYLTIKAAAAYIGATVWCVRQLIWDRKIPFVRLGNRYVIDRQDLDNYMQSQKVPAR